jgi:putative ABC transport system permease protein
MSRPRREIEIFRLACLDLWRDKRISLCMIAAVISVVAPLLILLGLKNGVVSQMRAELANQPHNLQLRLIGSHTLNTEWFEQMSKQLEVGFVIPLTRSLNTLGDLRRSSTLFLRNVELLPSADGDPLLAGQPAPVAFRDVWLSTKAAQDLAVTVGDQLDLLVTRQRSGQTETLNIELNVIGVMAAHLYTRPSALISLPLLVAIEDFKDNKPWPKPGLLSRPERNGIAAAWPIELNRELYPRARIYARSIEDVPSLSRALSDQGIETVSRLADIEAVQAIDRLLRLLFNVIAWLAIAGCAASLLGAFAANVDRKRRDLALLRLMGCTRSALMRYCLMQAMLLTTIGFLIGILIYSVASKAFDTLLAGLLTGNQAVTLISMADLGLAGLAAALVAVAVSSVAGWLAMRISPSEALRDV